MPIMFAYATRLPAVREHTADVISRRRMKAHRTSASDLARQQARILGNGPVVTIKVAQKRRFEVRKAEIVSQPGIAVYQYKCNNVRHQIHPPPWISKSLSNSS